MHRYHKKLTTEDHLKDDRHPSSLSSDTIHVPKDAYAVLHVIDNSAVNGSL